MLSKGKVNLNDLPEKFTLGKGHVRFFYDKGRYTLNRYLDIFNECVRRGFKVTYYGKAWDIYEQYPELFKNYTPTRRDRTIVGKRILERNGTI